MYNTKHKKSFPRNLKVIAINDGDKPGFDIFLDFSGRNEYLTSHRHSGLLFDILKTGIRVDDLTRMKHLTADACSRSVRDFQRTRSMKVENMVAHLIKVIDCYLAERCGFIGEGTALAHEPEKVAAKAA